jgi:hypothetical protein
LKVSEKASAHVAGTAGKVHPPPCILFRVAKGRNQGTKDNGVVPARPLPPAVNSNGHAGGAEACKPCFPGKGGGLERPASDKRKGASLADFVAIFR